MQMVDEKYVDGFKIVKFRNVVIKNWDDWTEVWINGKKVADGHSVHVADLLDALDVDYEVEWHKGDE
jgi:hypothetical protein